MKLDPWSYSEKGSEHSEQVALFSWCNMAANYGILQANDPESYNLTGYAKRNYYERGGKLVPELKRLFAIHNQGHGDVVRGARAAAEGVRTGVPDICLPVSVTFDSLKGPMGGIVCWQACGLYIELKRRKTKTQAQGRASEKQNDWIDFLRTQGYIVEVCYGWEEARDVILKYLELVDILFKE